MNETDQDLIKNIINKHFNLATRHGGIHLTFQMRPQSPSALIYAPWSRLAGPIGSVLEREFSSLCKILVTNFAGVDHKEYGSSNIYENIFIPPDAVTKNSRYHAIYFPRKNGIRELYITLDLTKSDREKLEAHGEYLNSLENDFGRFNKENNPEEILSTIEMECRNEKR